MSSTDKCHADLAPRRNDYTSTGTGKRFWLFEEGQHPGPDLSDFHFDLPEGQLSPWNQKAMDVLQERFAKRWDKQSEIDDIERSEQYWVDAEKQQFTTLTGIWRQPISIMIGNRIEMDLEAEFCL